MIQHKPYPALYWLSVIVGVKLSLKNVRNDQKPLNGTTEKAASVVSANKVTIAAAQTHPQRSADFVWLTPMVP